MNTVSAFLITFAIHFLQGQGLTFPDYPPVVTIETAEFIEKEAGIKAYGACVGKYIYIRKDVDLYSLEGSSTLIHELVHFSQGCPLLKDITHEKFLALEAQAYELQNRFLMLFGSPVVIKNPHTEAGDLQKEIKVLLRELEMLAKEIAMLKQRAYELNDQRIPDIVK